MSTRVLRDSLDQFLFALVVDELPQRQVFESIPNIGDVCQVVSANVVLLVAEKDAHFSGINVIEEQGGDNGDVFLSGYQVTADWAQL